MKITRDYLTSQELGYIVNAMLEKETALEKEVVKIALIAQIVCEDLDLSDVEDCNDIYDKVISDGTNFSSIITNYDVIDKLVAEETGVNKILKDFIDDISVKLENSIKNLDLNGVIKELKEVANQTNLTPVKTQNRRKNNGNS